MLLLALLLLLLHTLLLRVLVLLPLLLDGLLLLPPVFRRLRGLGLSSLRLLGLWLLSLRLLSLWLLSALLVLVLLPLLLDGPLLLLPVFRRLRGGVRSASLVALFSVRLARGFIALLLRLRLVSRLVPLSEHRHAAG